jgi:hypothetical protein
MLRRVALVRTDISEEPSASFIRVTRIGGRGTTLAATSNRRTLRSVGWTHFQIRSQIAIRSDSRTCRALLSRNVLYFCHCSCFLLEIE